jgi:hypothetical protein
MATEAVTAPAQAGEAIRLAAAVEAQFARLEAGAWPADRVDLERALAGARSALDEGQIAAAGQEGRSLGLEELQTRLRGG